MATLYPVFLKLGGRRVLLVGGGSVAASKLAALIEAGADVNVVAPTVCAEIRARGVRVAQRAFEPADLDGVWLAIAAATPEVNARVAAEAEARRVFVNAVDDPSHATAYLGGTLRRGGVTIAVSTDGAAPALAGLMREGLEAVLPDDLREWLDVGRRARDDWRAEGVPVERRRPLLLRALNARYERSGG